jgi:hypothetical protein
MLLFDINSRNGGVVMTNRSVAFLIAMSFSLCVSSCNKSVPAASDPNQTAAANPTSTANEQPAPLAKPLPAPVPQEPPPPIVIPAGTLITVNLLTQVGSKLSHAGDRFEASLAEPIVAGEKVVIPKGASASGTVTTAHPAGRFKGGATLDLALDTLAIHGVPHKIQTAIAAEQSKGKGKRTAGMVGGGAAGGALIGGLAGGGKGAGIGALVGVGAGTLGAAFTGKRDITLPTEAIVSFKLVSDIKVSQKSSPGSATSKE